MGIFRDNFKQFRFNLNNEFKAAIKTNMPFLPDWIEARIYDTGITGDGFMLQTDASFSFWSGSSVYSNKTERIKKEKGQKTENVTLRDSGTFWNSTKQNSTKGFFNLTANFNKGKEHIGDNFQILFEDARNFEKSVLSLNESEKNQIQELIREKILTKIKGK